MSKYALERLLYLCFMACFGVQMCFGLAWAAEDSSADATIHYSLIITDGTQHSAQISIHFPVQSAAELLLQMPNWRPGRYQIANLANGVSQLIAHNQRGENLLVRKDDKSSWRVQTKPGDDVTVQYELYANELGGRVRHIDDSHAYLDASGVFLYQAVLRDKPVEVRLQVPSGWQSRSGMNPCGEQCFVAADYDDLVDSPIETGIHQYRQFVVADHVYELALWGRGNADPDTIVNDLRKIIATTGKAFGDYPFSRYLFIVHQTNTETGATEHINSTVIQKTRWSFSPHKDYLNFLRTAAHEFFHTWNVKAYRPKELVPYNYQQENYSPLLWWAEGGTSYAEDQMVLRAGVQTRDEYMEVIAKLIDDDSHQPGRFVMSAASASFDEWILSGGERARNAQVGIYSRGALLSVALDLDLISRTNGKVHLLDVHRYLYRHFSVKQGGFDEQDIINVLNQLSHSDYSAWWAQYVRGTDVLTMTALLQQVGLLPDIEPAKENATTPDAPKIEKWAGLTIREDFDKEHGVIVTEVEKESPAWQAGLIGGDILVALDHMRVNPKDFQERLSSWPADEVTISFFRRDELRSTLLVLQKKNKGKLKLLPLPDTNRNQKRLYEAWLGLPWSDKSHPEK